jgi:hypothetical protein
MNVTVIGTGNMGSAFVRQLANAGHAVRVAGRGISPRHRLLAAGHPGVAAVTTCRSGGEQRGHRSSNRLWRCRGCPERSGRPHRQGSHRHHQFAECQLFRTGRWPRHVGSGGNLCGSAGSTADQSVQHALCSGAHRRSGLCQRTDCTGILRLGCKPVDPGPLRNARYLEPLAGPNIYLDTGQVTARPSHLPGSQSKGKRRNANHEYLA